MERKVFAALSGPPNNPVSETLHNELVHEGFRRSQNILYKPACEECQACISARVVVDQFEPTRSQRRTTKKNRDITAIVKPPEVTKEQYELLSTYLAVRHTDGGMANMALEDYRGMVEDTPVTTMIVEYRLGATLEQEGELIGAVLTDLLDDGLSMVYSFFKPDLASRSLGAYMILDHIRLAQKRGLPYLYLGYWIAECSKMDYKRRYNPVELLKSGRWELHRP